MATCIIKSHSLPITPETETASPWWCQPCQNQHRTRHSRAINELLKDQFTAAIVNFRHIVSPYLKQIRVKIGNVRKKQFTENLWLPGKQFFRSLKNNKKQILTKLLYQIQVYAITIDRLSKMDIHSQDATFNLKERNKIMSQVKADLNLLRCETQQQIAEKRQVIRKKVPLNLVDQEIPSAVNHLSDGLIKDFSILKNYSQFLNKCFAKLFKSKKIKKEKNRKRKTS